uniref:AAA domain-containing protein n=1 Tax=Panagrellus redivivus TaxID=6233 RepID=A0A7E4ZU28_PANRE
MLTGRESESAALFMLLDDGLKAKKPISAYVSGEPGTGKTLTTKAVLKSLKVKHQFDYVYISCVATNKKADVEKKILNDLDVKNVKTATCAIQLHKLFNSHAKPIVILLDEVDHLVVRRNALLCSVFKWPEQYKGRVVVIGIANSLDLTKRQLPQLQAAGFEPTVFSFRPYTKDQIVSIVKEYLSKNPETTTLDDRSIDLCARKVSSQTGDIRTALNVTAKVLREIQDEEEEREAEESENRRSPPPGNLRAKPTGLSTPKKNSMKAVIRVFNEVQSSPASRSELPYHSKVLLGTLMRLVCNTKTMATTRIKLMAGYEKVCQQLKITAMTGNDRLNMLDNLETYSIIKRTGTKAAEKITFIDEVGQARAKICDAALIASIDELTL